MIRRIRRMGKRVFYTVHNVVPHRYPALLPRAVMDHWVRQASRACDGLFVHTPELAGQLSSRLGGVHPPIFVSPHGVWTRREGHGADAAIPPLDERLSWRRLLFFGMIRRNKGLDLLLHALRELPGYSVTIAGESHEADYFRTEVRPLIESLRAAGVRIDLIDRFVPDEQLAELFATHSAVVLPYRRSFVAQSGVIFLSLAHELPVVASDAGGLRDLFAEFRVGRSFTGESPVALADAVRSLFADESRTALAEEMRRAREHYSWRHAAEETVAAYDAVLGRTRPTRVESDEVPEDDRALVTTSAD
jgi:glycosyltransferase involved in cell wall biosynthesis